MLKLSRRGVVTSNALLSIKVSNPCRKGVPRGILNLNRRRLTEGENILGMKAMRELSDPVTINNQQYAAIKEGKASILTQDAPRPTKYTSSEPANNGHGDQNVFYNPVQQFNRDLSVLAILVYGEGALVEKQRRVGNKGKGKQKVTKSSRGQGTDTATEESRNTSLAEIPAENQNPAIPLTNSIVSDTTHENTSGETDETAEKGIKRKRDRSDLGEEDHNSTADDEQNSPKRHCGSDMNEVGRRAQEPETGHQPGKNIVASTDNLQKEPDFSQNRTNGHTEPATDSHQRRKEPYFAILDALSASGLRAIRYAKEIPFVSQVVANDLSHDAVKAIKLNVNYNEVGHVVEPNVGDARAYMYNSIGKDDTTTRKSTRRFDVIDLDPYGTAAPYFDAALQALQDGGLLCVTCTDAGVFASSGYPEKAFGLYGGIPIKGPHSHEGGLRLILHAISLAAAKYSIAIEPLLSLSIDFYARLFIRIHKRQAEVKLLAGKMMLIYNCDSGCGSWTKQMMAKNSPQQDKNGDEFFKHGFAQAPSTTPYCEHCGFKTHLAGPMWGGPIHNVHFIQRLLTLLPSLDQNTYPTIKRMEGMLTLALEEKLDLPTLPDSPDDPSGDDCIPVPIIPKTPPSTVDPHPLFFHLSHLCRTIHVSTPSEDQFRGALRHLGYRVTRSHCKPGSIRTDAPFDVVWEIIREWARTKSPGKDGAVKPGTAGYGIMRRMRGTEMNRVGGMRSSLVERLMKLDNVADLKRELEAALFRLGRNGEAGSEASEQGDEQTDGRHEKMSKLNIIFDEKLGRERPKKGLVRYPMNPQPNWGPMNRATGSGSG